MQEKILIYEAESGQAQIELKLDKETLWLNLQQVATLFDRDKSVVSRHLSNIFKTGELDKNSVVAKNATTAADGKTYQVDYYNLDVIISVGYRVNSKKGTQFRIWATTRLKELLLQGYINNALSKTQWPLKKSAIRLLPKFMSCEVRIASNG